MALHRRQLPLLSLLLLAFLLAASSHGAASGDGSYDRSLCLWEPSSCGNVSVKYPFYTYNKVAVLQGNNGSYCGYPGLGIWCKDDQLLMELGRETYKVLNIDYNNFTVSLVDLEAFKNESCPMVDHNVMLPLPNSSWLYYPNTMLDYLIFFLNCNFAVGWPPVPKSFISIPCAKGPGKSFVLQPREYVSDEDGQIAACQKIIVPVLKDVIQSDPPNQPWNNSAYANALRTGFQLMWEQERNLNPSCKQCEGYNGRCAYNQTAEFVGCLCSDGQISVQNSTCSGNNKMTKGTIAGVVAGGFSLLLVAGVIAVFVVRKRKQNKGVNSSSKLLKYSGSGGTPCSQGRDTESGSVQDPPTHLFSYEELEEATDGFNDNRELGDGGFGTVYKGYLKDGRVVAVKRLYNNSYRRVEQFVNEAAILSRLRHPNLVMFYGCTSSSSRELLLVYEFVANGTVADHLHGHRAPERALSWPLRLNIAVESAAALTYLHAIEQPIVHRDVKTTNILLDADFHVKVADFGLSRLFPLDATHVSTAPQGTPGYVDPEYHQCYQLTDKSDVYSFGVVLVELISSMPAVDITRHRSEINLAGMAISKIQKCQLEELVDLELGYESDPATKKMMTMVAELAFRCLQQNGEMRPPIREVLEVLKAIQGECLVGDKGGDKDKGLGGTGPFSPNTVHAPWDSRATTPNTSRD